MNPQENLSTMTPDEAAASLAYATQLSEGMMPKGANPDSIESEEESKGYVADDQMQEEEDNDLPEETKKEVQDAIKELQGLLS